MVDSTAAYEPDSGAPSYVAINGVRPLGERRPRPGIHQPDDLEGAGPEHASALLRMGALKQDAGAYSEAEELYRRALEIGERSVGADSPALIPALTSLATALVLGGKRDDAQQIAVRTVAISEQGLGDREADVAIVINDLARLCLKESAHSVAEPLLLGLLEMKRSKGEDHPEVGTVLASLATVRHALGRHESAEQLWRRVLEIRERTLAPNHFSLAIALEHLAEACAARGKIVEALQLFQRAQTIRELTLGAAHPSLRIARDRIADLQLQAGESLDASVPAPEKYRLLASNPSVSSPIVSAPPPAWERPTQPRKGTARVVEREQSRVVERAPTVENFSPAHPAPAVAPVSALGTMDAPVNTEPPKSESASFRDVILSIQQDIDEEQDEAKAGTVLGANLLASFVGAVKERQKATVIGVGVIGLLIVLATVSRAWTEPDQSAPGAKGSLAALHRVAAASGAVGSEPPTVLSNNPVSAGATASAAATPVTASRIRLAEQRSSEQRPAKKPNEKTAEPTRISIPSISKGLAVSTASLDSIVRERSGAARADADPISFQPALTPTSQRLTFDRDDQVNPRLRAQLIGPLPTPRYPAQLQGVEGELTARFEVDAAGRPVMSTVSVVNSPHELLTAAVLKVIPGIRFEPARSGGENSKAVADVVQLTFRFQAKK